jgi:hypothetical protein
MDRNFIDWFVHLDESEQEFLANVCYTVHDFKITLASRGEDNNRFLEQLKSVISPLQSNNICNTNLLNTLVRNVESGFHETNTHNTNLLSALARDVEAIKMRPIENRLMDELKQKMVVPNHILGRVGEEQVMDTVKSIWTRATFEGTASQTGMSDFHALGPRGRVVFEVKNKAVIAKTDIDKSLKDIALLRERHSDFKAYVFVSVASTNIPNKGNLFIERIGDVFVVWLGVEGDLKGPLQIVLKTLECLIEINLETADYEVNAVVGAIQASLDPIRQNERFIESMQKSVSTIQRDINQMRICNGKALDGLRMYCAETLGALGHMVCGCGKSYKIERYFNEHVVKCKGK